MSPWLDPQWVLWFQQLTAAAAPLWRAATFLGDETFYLVLFPLLYWAVSPGLGLRLGLALLLSAQVNGGLKFVFHSPRPFWVEPAVRPAVEATSFGLPSGHSQNAVVLWGRWAWEHGPGARAAAMGLALLIGLSRVALGVHFWGDVLLGWLVGAGLLALLLAAEPRLQAWVRRVGPWTAAGTGLAASGAGLLLALGVRAWAAAGTPPDWTAAWSPNGLLTAAGTWVGMLLGWAWLRDRGGFSAAGSWPQRAARLVVGFAGVLLLWAGLRTVLPAGEGFVPALARWLRYAAVGAWVTAGAPWLFRRWGWARPRIPAA